MERIRYGLILLIAITALGTEPMGSSGNNGGNEEEGRLQYIARTRIVAAIKHSKNKDLLTEVEREAILAVIKAGVPFVVQDPEALDKTRYEDGKDNPAEIQPASATRTGKKIRARFLDVNGEQVDARVVWDKTRKYYIVQWDEVSMKLSTNNGSRIPESLVRDVAHEVLRYAYFTKKISRNDDARILSNDLFVPAADQTLELPSAEYRYDFKRRSADLTLLAAQLVHLLDTDLKGHSGASAVLDGYKKDASMFAKFAQSESAIRQHLGNRGIEDMAENFDAVERNMRGQRERFIEQINFGHRPLGVTAPAGRMDFESRAAYLGEVAKRIVDLVEWHQNLRTTREGREAKEKAAAGGAYFIPFDRRDWDKDDELAAKKFDEWEAYLVPTWQRLRKQAPLRR